MLTLRAVHILFGTFWVGAILFTVLFLEPSVSEAGPEGGKVMQGLQKRRLMVVIPIAALLTILSGIDLYRRLSGGFNPSWIHSHMGMTLSVGAVASIIAFLLGFFVMRPAMIKAAALGASMQGISDATARSAAMEQVQALRARSRLVSRVVMVLLILALLTMAVARYM